MVYCLVNRGDFQITSQAQGWHNGRYTAYRCLSKGDYEMKTYKIKDIDVKVVNRLKSAIEKYKSCEKANRTSALSELSNAFSEVVKARSQAIDEAIPNSDLKHMTYVPDYKTIIILDEEIESLLKEATDLLLKTFS